MLVSRKFHGLFNIGVLGFRPILDGLFSSFGFFSRLNLPYMCKKRFCLSIWVLLTGGLILLLRILDVCMFDHHLSIIHLPIGFIPIIKCCSSQSGAQALEYLTF